MHVPDMRLDGQDRFAFICLGRGASNTARSLEERMVENDLQGFNRHQRELNAEELSRARKVFRIAELDCAGSGVGGCSGGMEDGSVDI